MLLQNYIYNEINILIISLTREFIDLFLTGLEQYSPSPICDKSRDIQYRV